jgi:hypothetical protein
LELPLQFRALEANDKERAAPELVRDEARKIRTKRMGR